MQTNLFYSKLLHTMHNIMTGNNKDDLVRTLF